MAFSPYFLVSPWQHRTWQQKFDHCLGTMAYWLYNVNVKQHKISNFTFSGNMRQKSLLSTLALSCMDSSLKNIWHTSFFLCELSPFLELCPFEKIRMKSDACHFLWTVHARVLKFHIWISHGKIADPYFFLVRVISLSGVMLLWKKKKKKKKNGNEILSARYLKRYLSQGLQTWSANRGWWVDNLINFWTNSVNFSGVMAL